MYDLYRKKFCRLRGSDEMDLSEVLEKSDMLKKKKMSIPYCGKCSLFLYPGN